MTDLLNPREYGKICIEFSNDALTRATPEDRDAYLKMVRLRLSNELEKCRMESGMISNWMIEL